MIRNAKIAPVVKSHKGGISLADLRAKFDSLDDTIFGILLTREQRIGLLSIDKNVVMYSASDE